MIPRLVTKVWAAVFLLGVVPPRVAKAAPADDSEVMAEGHREFSQGNYAAAIKSFQSASALNDSDAESFYWLGRSYYEVPDYDKAITAEQKAVATDPRNSIYHDWLGRAYGGKADRERSFFLARKVKSEFEEAVRLNPSNITARRDLEDYSMTAPGIVGGSKDEARAQIEAIAAIDPAEGHLAQAAFEKGGLKKTDQAEAEYRLALEAKPTRIEAYRETADFFIEQGKPADLDVAVNAAALLSPNDPTLAYYRGVSGVLAGSDPAGSEQYLKSYIASAPSHSDWPSHAAAREWLGRLYESQGKTADAVEQYRASLQLDPDRPQVKERLKNLEKRFQ